METASSKSELLKKESSLTNNQEVLSCIDSLRNALSQNSQTTSIIFLFASPLIANFASSSSMNLPQLNFNKEFEVIEKALEESRIQINYQRTVATLDNLPDVLIRNPFVLHFSGHGVKNNIESIGSEAAIRTGEGDMLLFEDSKWWGVLLSEKNLKSILERWRTDIKLVVVLSCHSEFIGNIFYNAGIPHVVWIQEKEKISDAASIIFASAFYKLLFGGNSCNICQAFEGAKAAVKLQRGIKWNAGEDLKFLLKCTVFLNKIKKYNKKNSIKFNSNFNIKLIHKLRYIL